MAYAHKVLRVTAFGSCFGGDEQWSTGFYVGEPSSDVANPGQLTADAILGLWQTFFTSTGVSVMNTYKTEGIRVALMKTDGKMDPLFNYYAYPTVPFSGANVGAPMPPQTALVATLQATPDRGLGAKGRMFLPGINHQLASDGKLSSTNVSSILTALRTFLNGVNAHADVPGTIVNASRGGTGLNPLPPITRTVQNVLMGNVYDTQRRRRNTMSEAYQTLTVTI